MNTDVDRGAHGEAIGINNGYGIGCPIADDNGRSIGRNPRQARARAVSAEAVRGLRPTTDLHGSTEYRIGLLRTMTERALSKAAQRAKRGAS